MMDKKAITEAITKIEKNHAKSFKELWDAKRMPEFLKELFRATQIRVKTEEDEDFVDRCQKIYLKCLEWLFDMPENYLSELDDERLVSDYLKKSEV